MSGSSSSGTGFYSDHQPEMIEPNEDDYMHSPQAVLDQPPAHLTHPPPIHINIQNPQPCNHLTAAPTLAQRNRSGSFSGKDAASADICVAPSSLESSLSLSRSSSNNSSAAGAAAAPPSTMNKSVSVTCLMNLPLSGAVYSLPPPPSTNAASSSSSLPVTSSQPNLLYGYHRPRRLILGVCAMDKKARSKPMTQILDRLRAYGEFDIIIFGDSLICDESLPVESWPLVHCLISFTSKHFPLQKVIEYVRLRKPFCVNDLPSQTVLQNRYDVYKILEKNSIPTPRHLYVDRSKGAGPNVEEYDDYIVIDGVRLDKPLVEKPYDGEDHNIYIYYGKSQGGGSRRLFRKVGNRSSRFYPKVNSLRKNGSFIYESLLMQGKVGHSFNAAAFSMRRRGTYVFACIMS